MDARPEPSAYKDLMPQLQGLSEIIKKLHAVIADKNKQIGDLKCKIRRNQEQVEAGHIANCRLVDELRGTKEAVEKSNKER